MWLTKWPWGNKHEEINTIVTVTSLSWDWIYGLWRIYHVQRKGSWSETKQRYAWSSAHPGGIKVKELWLDIKERKNRSNVKAVLQLASLCVATWKVTNPVLRDFKGCGLDGNFIYQDAEPLETPWLTLLTISSFREQRREESVCCYESGLEAARWSGKLGRAHQERGHWR